MSEKTPTQQVSEWLAALGAALERGDVAGAVALFGDDSYWRDLVSFTWNITTAGGQREGSAQMLERAVISAKPLSLASRGRGQRGRRRDRRLVHASRPPWRAATVTCG